MAKLDGGTTIAGYTALHSGLANAYLGGNLIFSGNISTAIGTVSFGSQLRQMINLWNTSFAVGVQSNTLYFRTGTAVAFYRLGQHSDTAWDPGSGGILLAGLDSLGLYVSNSSSMGLNNFAASAWFRPQDAGGNLHIKAAGNAYLDGNTKYFRDVAGTQHGYWDANGIYATSYIRAGGNTGFYFQAWDLGFTASDGTWIRNYSNKGGLKWVRNTAAINNSSFDQGNISVNTTDSSNPIIGFHREGYTALALYHVGYGNNNMLRIRSADGIDAGVVVTRTSSSGLTAAEVDNATSMSSGIYTTNGAGISGLGGTWWHIVHSYHGTDGYAGQIAWNYYGGDGAYYRSASGGTWGAWKTMGGGVKTVQHGAASGGGVFDVIVNAVNTAKAFLILNHDMWMSGGSGSGEYRGEILNATTLRFYFGSGQASGTGNWELVEYN